MSYRVSTQVYSGPFDLLLQLVTRQKVDIGAISISEVAEQYLAEAERIPAPEAGGIDETELEVDADEPEAGRQLLRRLMCSAAGEKACSATASVRMCLTIRCFTRLRRHRLSRRRRVCKARRFRALRHICAPRRRHGIPAMRSHRMSVYRS